MFPLHRSRSFSRARGLHESRSTELLTSSNLGREAATASVSPSRSNSMSLKDEHQHQQQSPSTEISQGNRTLTLGRSRSNTAASTLSTYHAARSSTRSSERLLTRESSNDSSFSSSSTSSSLHRSTGRSETQPSQRSIMSRMGKRSKRYNGKFSLSSRSTNSLAGIQESVSRGHDADRSKSPEETHVMRKRKISEPYNFQHITHTSPGQFPQVDKTTLNELASEFCAVRASQASRPELKGIRADTLQPQSPPTEAVSPSPSSVNTSTPSITSPANSPRRPPMTRDRSWSSVENNCRGEPCSARKRGGSLSGNAFQAWSRPIIAPPRTSSRAAFTVTLDEDDENQQTKSEMESDGLRNGRRTPSHELSQTSNLSTLADEPEDLATDMEPGAPHAVTTPDDTAWPLKAPTPELVVPEMNPADETDTLSPLRDQANQGIGRTARQSRSLADMRTVSQKRLSRFYLDQPFLKPRDERPVSSGSDTLGQSHCQADYSSKRRSAIKPAETTWEDDVDFCYEHELEADCDYDWDRCSQSDLESSKLESSHDQTMLSLSCSSEENVSHSEDIQPSRSRSDEKTTRAADSTRPSLLVATHLEVPDLDPSPAKTSSTIESEATTPHCLHPPRPRIDRFSIADSFKESDGFTLSPSLLIPPDYMTQIMREEEMQDFLDRAENKDHDEYPMYGQALEYSESAAAESNGSGSAPLSKCNSQESMNLSRHRSLNSASSPPELVHSSRNRRLEFDAAVQQLSEHMASLTTEAPTESLHHGIPQPAAYHRREKSLAKEVGRQSVLMKQASNSSLSAVAASCIAPPAIPQRRAPSTNSSGSDSNRGRSDSSSSQSASTRPYRSNRISYTLFPSH